MTETGFCELVRRATAIEQLALARWMVECDHYARRLGATEQAELAALALADGEEAARALRIGAGPAAVETLAAGLGVSVALDDGEIAVGGHIFCADYRPSPPRIRLYTRAIAAIDRGLARSSIARRLGAARSEPVLLAHELYHHLDLARPASLAQRHRVTSLKLGRLHVRTELPSLAEIAAGRFAATLLGLHCHPKLLDLLLLWDCDPQKASAWVAALDAFDSTFPHMETV